MPGLRTTPDESGFKSPSGGAVHSPGIYARAEAGVSMGLRSIRTPPEALSIPPKRPLQPPHLPLPPSIPRLIHQRPRPRHMPPRRGELLLVPAEARPLQVRVALVQAHQAALGNLQRLGEIRRSAGEVATK